MSWLSSDPPDSRLSLLSSTPQQLGRHLINHHQHPILIIPPNMHPPTKPTSPCWNILTDSVDHGTEKNNVTADTVNDDDDATVALTSTNATADSLMENQTNNDELLLKRKTASTPTTSTTVLLPPIYSNPKETSLAYHSGLLKSDYSITSNGRSLRMAVRYQLERYERSSVSTTTTSATATMPRSRQKSTSSTEDNDNNNNNNNNDDNDNSNEDNDDLFLCWISQDGIPHHFRRMHPREKAVVVARHEAASLSSSSYHDDNHDGSRSSSNHQMLVVTENDIIETTYPGHAFVFCHHVGSICDGENNQKCGSTNARSDSDPIIVQEEDGMTFFLRKAKLSCENKEEGDNGVVSWEKYLIVGGYRPGIMSEVVLQDDNNDGNKNNNSVSDVTSEVKEVDETGLDDDDDEIVKSSSNESIDHNEYNNSDDESDESDDDEEQILQLVCITKKQKTDKRNNDINPVKQTEEDKDEEQISPSICCPGFLSNLTRSKSRHVPPFLATKPYDSTTTTTTMYKFPRLLSNDEGEYTITVSLSRLDSTPLDTSNKQYDDVILGGWPCRVEPGCFPPDMTIPGGGRNLLRMRFELDLMAASMLLPPDARSKLKKCTLIWINKSQSYGPKVAPVRARDACFHPGAGWLKKVGMSTDKCGGIEFFDARHYLSDCDLWGPGGLMLHELSHAWHCKFIKDGYDNQDIINVYNNAMEDGLYDCVRVRGPQGPTAKAYACENQMEYFAELSVAFLGGLGEDEHNKWYPFNRSQLKEHDPRAFAMMCRMWGVEE
jgi:hypothetical protein